MSYLGKEFKNISISSIIKYFKSKIKNIHTKKITEVIDATGDNIESQLSEIFTYPVLNKQQVSSNKIPCGILIYGAPNIDKSKIVKTLAKKSNSNFFQINLNQEDKVDVLREFTKVEETIDNIYNTAPNAHSIVLFDNIETIKDVQIDIIKELEARFKAFAKENKFTLFITSNDISKISKEFLSKKILPIKIHF